MAKKIVKMRCTGELFELSHYPKLYRLPNEPETARGKRCSLTTFAKQKINARERKAAFMRIAQANFRAGRDLAVCLHFSVPVDRATGQRAIQRFFALQRKRYAEEWKKLPAAEKRKYHNRKLDHDFRAMKVMEDHSEDGQPVDLHFHLLLTRNPDPRKQALRGIIEDWEAACRGCAGSVKVETLEGSDCFKQLAAYYLKMKRDKNCRAWTKTRNCKPAPQPIYQQIPERDIPDTPPGCVFIDGQDNYNDIIGVWGYRICRIADRRKFVRWWNRQINSKKRLE